jgi:hypothetical protein
MTGASVIGESWAIIGKCLLLSKGRMKNLKLRAHKACTRTQSSGNKQAKGARGRDGARGSKRREKPVGFHGSRILL